MGLIVGSFLNVVIYRVPLGKSIVFPPSSCPSCRAAIKWYDNIPILSYFLLKAKCRSCKSVISLKYPIIEFITGMLFIIFFVNFGLEKIYFFYIIIAGYLIVLSAVDFDKKIVPDKIVVLLTATGLIFCLFNFNKIDIFEGIAGAVAGGLIIYFLGFFSNGKIGEGDIKLIFALGLCTGIAGIIDVVFYSFLIGGAVAIVLLVSGKKKKSDSLAFVPFIAVAFLLQVFI